MPRSVERLKELRLERGRIGLSRSTPAQRLPAGQPVQRAAPGPPGGRAGLHQGLHARAGGRAQRGGAAARKAGMLCERAMQAMVARARPGVPEYELRAAAGAAILDGGGDIDFLIIGSTPMADPAMVFGNPRPSHRRLPAATSSTWSSQPATTASRRRSARRSRSRRPTWCASSGTRSRARLQRSSPRSGPATPPTTCGSPAVLPREGRAVAPHQVHGIDIVTDKPHVFAERTEADEIDKVLRPGMIIMAEPNPITPTGCSGSSWDTPSSSPPTATNASTAFRWKSRSPTADPRHGHALDRRQVEFALFRCGFY